MKQNAIRLGIVLLVLIASPKKGGAAAPISEEVFQISFLGSSGPRGVRNNNPGNIKINDSNNWQGKISRNQNTDGVFEQFSFYVYGVRAMIVLVRNYINQGEDTISKIINRYAPSGTSENNPTSVYINTVASESGFGIHQNLNQSFETLSKVVTAMVKFENGQSAIDQAMFAAAWSIA